MKLHDPKHLQEQLQFTKPDYVLFVPSQWDYESDNVHLYTVYHPALDGLIAFWTQSSVENKGNNHIVMAQSTDGGKTWTSPRFLLGSTQAQGGDEFQASWAVPMVSRSGKIYLFYYQEVGYRDFHRQISGVFSCITSTDLGATWSEPQAVPQRQTPFDAQGPTQNNLVFQLPMRDPSGKYVAAFTKWTSEQCTVEKKGSTRIYFMRFENLDEDPEPSQLVITHLPDSERGIELLRPSGNSMIEEPAFVFLPDGRIFCSMRTDRGSVHYSVSADNGKSFTPPKPLCFDDGSPFVHCISPCPLYDLEDGRYLQFYHGRFDQEKPYALRNPLRYAIGSFDPDGEQPIRFSKDKEGVFMALPEDADPFPGVVELALYGSVTKQNGKRILWYPDRKFFLLGKNLDF